MASDSLVKLLQDVREQISSGEIQMALDQLQGYLGNNVPVLRNEVSLHAARYNRLRRDERRGLISREAAKAEQTRLEKALLDFLDEIPKHISTAMSPSPRPAAMAEEVQLPDNFKPEKIIGINNLKQISWLQRGLEVSRSVCRILTPNGLGTGFMIGSNCLMTNNHVIPTAEMARQSYAEFNYQQDATGGYLPTFRYRLQPAVFRTSPQNRFDYTIVSLEANPDLPLLESWGALFLNPGATPVPTEHVIVIQHPNGGLKQIVMTANQVVNCGDRYLHYTTDTMAGSSGSPVFNDLWQVIAIHHADGGIKQDKNGANWHVNEGVLMSVVRADAGDCWPQV
jgi:V8-like Glu-specific endopeptidase